MEELTSFLTNVGTILSSIIDWMGQVLSFITANPIIYVSIIGVFLISFTVGLLMRLFRA